MIASELPPSEPAQVLDIPMRNRVAGDDGVERGEEDACCRDEYHDVPPLLRIIPCFVEDPRQSEAYDRHFGVVVVEEEVALDQGVGEELGDVDNSEEEVRPLPMDPLDEGHYDGDHSPPPNEWVPHRRYCRGETAR